MALFTWDKSYTVGIAQFDGQHQKLVAILNQLHDAMHQGQSKQVLGKVLGELINYTATHFAAEEKIMTEHKFPGLAAHKKEHEDLVHKALALQSDFESGKVGVSMDTMTFLRDWLKNHILGTDRLYGAYLNGKGIH